VVTDKATDFSNLGRHTRTHTKEKPFRCSHEGCDYRAAQSGSIKSHITRKHSTLRAFACPQCVYTAKTEADLKKHTSRRTGKCGGA